MKHILRLLAVVTATTALAVATASPSHIASRGLLQASKPEPAAAALVGTWRLVEHVNWDAAGKIIQQFGPRPIGYFVHDGTGHASVQIMRTPAVRPAAGGPDGATVDELRDLLRGYYAAFGTYSVDTARAEGVYHVEGSTVPEIIGTDVRLPYRIEGDSLIVGDGKTWRRVWQRVK